MYINAAPTLKPLDVLRRMVEPKITRDVWLKTVVHCWCWWSIHNTATTTFRLCTVCSFRRSNHDAYRACGTPFPPVVLALSRWRRLVRAGGGAHARGGFAAAKSGGASEVRAADKVYRHPRLPHHHHVSPAGVEALGLGGAGCRLDQTGLPGSLYRFGA